MKLNFYVVALVFMTTIIVLAGLKDKQTSVNQIVFLDSIFWIEEDIKKTLII